MAYRSRLLAACAAVAVLSACTASPGLRDVVNNSNNTATSSTTTGSAPTSTSETRPSEPYATVTPTLELNDQTTKPGTKLKMGQQAIVPFHSRYATGLMGITATVESVKAPDADIDKLPLGDEDKGKLRGKNFFFVHISMVNIDGANFADIQPPNLTAGTRSGGIPGILLGLGDVSVTGCDDTTFAPKDFSTKGAKFDQCALRFGSPSDPITSLQYTNQPYETSATKAITWKA
jgi:hypothetical protein